MWRGLVSELATRNLATGGVNVGPFVRVSSAVVSKVVSGLAGEMRKMLAVGGGDGRNAALRPWP